MDTKRWERIQDLFHRALDMPAGTAAEFVRAEAPEDVALAEEVNGAFRFRCPHCATRLTIHRIVCREPGKMLADSGRTGEGQLADYRAAEQVAADRVGNAEHALHHIAGHACIEQGLHDGDASRRRFFARLDDGRTARRQRAADLAHHIERREIPWREACHRADRVILDFDAAPLGPYKCASVKPFAFPGIEFEQHRGIDRLALGLCQRLTLFAGQRRADFARALLDQPGGFEQDRRALVCAGLAPGVEPALCRCERSVEILCRRMRQLADHFASRRVDHILGHAPAAGNLFARDQQVEGRIVGHRSSPAIVR